MRRMYTILHLYLMVAINLHRLWLISKTTKRPTTSEFLQLFRTSAKFFQSACLAILYQAFRDASHSLCLVPRFEGVAAAHQMQLPILLTGAERAKVQRILSLNFQNKLPGSLMENQTSKRKVEGWQSTCQPRVRVRNKANPPPPKKKEALPQRKCPATINAIV